LPAAIAYLINQGDTQSLTTTTVGVAVMDDKQLQLFAHEIANQTAFHNWEYWLTLLAVSFIAAYLGSYLAKSAEHAANKANLNKILDQLAQTTRMTASIQSVVSLGEWSERERRTLRRVKLEELMVAAHKSSDWIMLEKRRLFFSSDDPETVSPLPLVVTLGKLFFSELREKITEFDRVCADHRAFFNAVQKKLLEAKIRAVEEAMTAGKAAGNWAGWQADSDTRAAQAQMNVRDACSVELQVGDQAVFAALSELDEAAAALMAKIIAAPPSS
jgi:hypothetical protein